MTALSSWQLGYLGGSRLTCFFLVNPPLQLLLLLVVVVDQGGLFSKPNLVYIIACLSIGVCVCVYITFEIWLILSLFFVVRVMTNIWFVKHSGFQNGSYFLNMDCSGDTVVVKLLV